jgi:hypothetical protein
MFYQQSMLLYGVFVINRRDVYPTMQTLFFSSQCPGIELKTVIVHKEIQPQLLIHVYVIYINLNTLFIEQHQE